MADALAYIKRLEAEVECAKPCIDTILAEVLKLERERDTLLKNMLVGPTCETCKYKDGYYNVPPCSECFESHTTATKLMWRWRGAVEGDG